MAIYRRYRTWSREDKLHSLVTARDDTPQPVQHLVFWEAPAKFIRRKGASMTYLKMMKNYLGIGTQQMKRDAINRQGHWAKAS